MAKGRGRPAFKVTPTLSRQVEELVSCGMSEDEIARVIGCATTTLRKHFEEPLRSGHSKRRAEVIRLLYRSARGGNVSAQKKLLDMTDVSAAFVPPEPVAEKPPKLGKKEQQQQAAVVADQGTDWAGLLDPVKPSDRPN